jgi:hypothetical protein
MSREWDRYGPDFTLQAMAGDTDAAAAGFPAAEGHNRLAVCRVKVYMPVKSKPPALRNQACMLQ